MYYIAHYGVKKRSGRYPYGSGDRPYQGEERGKSYSKFQNEDNKQKGNKKFNDRNQNITINVNVNDSRQSNNKKFNKSQQNYNKNNQQSSNNSNQQNYNGNNQEQTPEQQWKNSIMNSGNAQLVNNAKTTLSNKELRDAIDRVDMYRKIDSLSEKERNAGFYKMNEAMNKVSTVVNWAKTGLDIYYTYNSYKKLFNSGSNNSFMNKSNKQSNNFMNSFNNKNNQQNSFMNRPNNQQKVKSYAEQMEAKGIREVLKRTAKEKKENEKKYKNIAGVGSTLWSENASGPLKKLQNEKIAKWTSEAKDLQSKTSYPVNIDNYVKNKQMIEKVDEQLAYYYSLLKKEKK